MNIHDEFITAKDDYRLAATVYEPDDNPTQTVITINSATAVPRRFYRHLAQFLSEAGYTVITYDYRGIGDSAPESLRGFDVKITDWVLDIESVLDWAHETYQPSKLWHMGHSFGGQVAGLLPNTAKISAMTTFSSQSGYWKMQGGWQKPAVLFHMYVTFPLLSHVFGYMPWSKVASSEDLPKGVALDWARWCRHPGYLRGDTHLPLARYGEFNAPVLAYSFADDNWGTRESVDDMMSIYPHLERRHIVPSEFNLSAIGHFGYFRPTARILWEDTLEWWQEQV